MGNTTPMGISLAPPVFCANTAAPRPSPITSPIIRMTTDIAARPFRAALVLVFVAPPFMAALVLVFAAPPFMAALFFAMNLHMATHLPCILVPAQPWPHPLAIARFCQQLVAQALSLARGAVCLQFLGCALFNVLSFGVCSEVNMASAFSYTSVPNSLRQ